MFNVPPVEACMTVSLGKVRTRRRRAYNVCIIRIDSASFPRPACSVLSSLLLERIVMLRRNATKETKIDRTEISTHRVLPGGAIT